jgi:hypothetical protein
LYFEFVSDFVLRISDLQRIRSTKLYVRNYQKIIQNKPKVKDAKMNVSPFITIKYVKLDTWCNRKNKPKQTQFKPKTNPISKKPKMNVNIYYTIDYSNKPYLSQIQNKPKQTQFQTQLVVSLSNLFQTQFGFFLSQNRLIPHYIVRTRIINNFLRC